MSKRRLSVIAEPKTRPPPSTTAQYLELAHMGMGSRRYAQGTQTKRVRAITFIQAPTSIQAKKDPHVTPLGPTRHVGFLGT